MQTHEVVINDEVSEHLVYLADVIGCTLEELLKTILEAGTCYFPDNPEEVSGGISLIDIYEAIKDGAIPIEWIPIMDD